MARYDVHQHLLPPRLLEALRARREPPRLESGRLELREGSFPFDDRAHDLGERLARLDRDGIDIAVISLPPTLETDEHPELVAAYHEGILELVGASEGRLRAFASGACLDGFAGACVSAGSVVAGLGELPEELDRAGQVLFVHPGPPAASPPGAPSWWAAGVDYPAQMQAAYFVWIAGGAREHPDLPAVFSILAGGAPFQLERLRLRGLELRSALLPNVYLDTASYGRRALELCLETFGAGQLLFGSDVPVIDASSTLRSVGVLGKAVVAAVCTENPARLFP